MHEAIRSGLDTLVAMRHRARQPDRGAQRAARHLQAADQRCQQRARPATLETAPAIVDGLPQCDRHRPVRHRDAVNVDGLADAGVVDELVGNTPDVGCRHIANGLRPLRRVGLHMFDQAREAGAAREHAFGQHLVVGTNLDCIGFKAAFKRFLQVRTVMGASAARGEIPDQRLAAGAITQVIAVRPDQIGRGSANRQEWQIQALAWHLMQQHMDQRVEEASVGLGLDRHPLRRTRAGD